MEGDSQINFLNLFTPMASYHQFAQSAIWAPSWANSLIVWGCITPTPLILHMKSTGQRAAALVGNAEGWGVAPATCAGHLIGAAAPATSIMWACTSQVSNFVEVQRKSTQDGCHVFTLKRCRVRSREALLTLINWDNIDYCFHVPNK
jgi:hypothetical protein